MSANQEEAVTVIQADRDAAAEYGMRVLRWNRDVVDAIDFGRADDDGLVKAFARHRTSSSDAATPEGVEYEERLQYEQRILAVEMQLVAAQRALTPFATKACGWEQNHPGHYGTDSTQISHRLGDFRAARSVLTKIDQHFEESAREG